MRKILIMTIIIVITFITMPSPKLFACDNEMNVLLKRIINSDRNDIGCIVYSFEHKRLSIDSLILLASLLDHKEVLFGDKDEDGNPILVRDVALACIEAMSQKDFVLKLKGEVPVGNIAACLLEGGGTYRALFPVLTENDWLEVKNRINSEISALSHRQKAGERP